ncbi:tyrosine-type recombinase/integrase [Nitratireductor aquimarinus]|uniref:tyrosine-type recombinase/integrase n=1 Tax=Nitratireductor aquimarinus TaxID=889300 RepID=UPI0029358721|nr:tyrosine-type recombinase/integrase [Nitratireductor aquimarinus]MDV2966388.1 tyrosine-type recombinase/integrase [Nitratireductor aquimarinus]
MSDMPRRRKPYIQKEITRHNTTVWYFRRGKGPRIRLPGPYDSDEFNTAYEAALSGETQHRRSSLLEHRQGSVAWLIRQYRLSAAYRNLADITRKNRDAILKQVEQTAGNLTAAKVTPEHIRAGLKRREGKPGSQRNFLRAMRHLFQWAVPEHVPSDPTAGEKVRMPKTQGHAPWSVDMIDRYHAKHKLGTKARLAMDLMLYTGLRRSDVVRLGPQHIRDGVLTIRLKKSQELTEVILPVLPPLKESIDATEVGDLAFLVTQYGKPFTAAGFGNWFADQCIDAGVEGRAHGLRKAAATFAADNGATPHELMAIFGWQNLKEAETYTKAADRKRAALKRAHLILRSKA